jgi:hypothetical protein
MEGSWPPGIKKYLMFLNSHGKMKPGIGSNDDDAEVKKKSSSVQ